MLYYCCVVFFVDSILAQKSVVQTIVLDAGHGGKDPGAPGTGRYTKTEKHIALDVTLKLGKYLKEAFPEMKIVYTRTKDTFPTLKDRTDIANNSNADLFISIHCDSFTKSSAKGSSSHVMGLRYTEANLRVAQKENSVIFLEDNYEENYDGFDPNSPESIIAFSLSQTTYLNQSILIAQKIQEQFRERVKRTDRGVKQTPLWVTRATNMPSVLVELGFISNPSEEDFHFLEATKFIKRIPVLNKIKADSTKLFFKNDTTQKGVIFKVQIKTSMEEKEIASVMKYKVDFFKEKNMFKYTIGNEKHIAKAREIKKIAVENGYKDAFIIAFLNNKKIGISDAINIQKQ